MHLPILAGLWFAIMGLLITSGLTIHQRYQRAMKQTVQQFERDWKLLEKHYETQL